MPDKAFRPALVAADHAGSLGAPRAAAEQRRRVAELWIRVSPEARGEYRSAARLWCGAAEAAARAGWVDSAVDAADAARQVMEGVSGSAPPPRTWRSGRCAWRTCPITGPGAANGELRGNTRRKRWRRSASQKAFAMALAARSLAHNPG